MTPALSPRTFALLTRILIYVYCVNAFALPAADTDLWGHLKFGQETWETGSIQKTDHYSYTAQGLPWINHEWLTEVFFYLLFLGFGSAGLLMFKLLAGLFIIHRLSEWYFSKHDNLPAYVLIFVLLAPVLSLGFSTRPQLMTLLFITLLILIFQSFFDGNKKVLVWSPLLVLVWTNSHGGVVAGMGLFGMVTLVEWVRCYRTGEVQGRLLLKYFTLSCLAMLVNPYGYKLLTYFAQTLFQKRDITEWDSIVLFDSSFIYFKAMVFLFLATAFIRAPKRPWEVIIILLSIFYGFKHLRHSVIAGIVMTPYLLQQMAGWMSAVNPPPIPSQITRRAKPILAGIMVLFILFQASRHYHTYASAEFQIQVDPLQYPVYAVRFLKENNIQGNILTPFDWGEYLIWKLPESKVSIDGRFRTVYPEKIFIHNLVFEHGGSGWEYTLDHYPNEIILSNKKNKELDRRTDWIKIYNDPVASIYIPKADPPSPVMEKFSNKELVYNDDPPSWNFP